MTMTKQKALAKLQSLNAQLASLDIELKNLPIEKQTFRPSESKWSVLQVLEHLRASESLSLRYLNYKREQQEETSKNTGLKQSVAMWMLKRRYNNPKPIKGPDAKALNPDLDGLEYNKLMSQWKDSRKDLQKFLESTPEEMFNKALYKHPILGRINLGQMLQFFELHVQRHHRQIKELI